jgi:hypothetical protein
MTDLAAILKGQKGRSSDYIIGQSVTAADFYCAAFSNFVALQPLEIMPLDPAVLPMFENTPVEVTPSTRY